LLAGFNICERIIGAIGFNHAEPRKPQFLGNEHAD
jgi:hypothetical protein